MPPNINRHGDHRSCRCFANADNRNEAELLFLPLIGLFFLRAGCIAVDRAGGITGIAGIAQGGGAALAWAFGVDLSTGTRVLKVPATAMRWVCLPHDATGLPVVPVALNSGHVWPRNSGNQARWCSRCSVSATDCARSFAQSLHGRAGKADRGWYGCHRHPT